MLRTIIRALSAYVIALCLTVSCVSPVRAAQTSSAVQGYYTVNFLANGDAVVYARIVISHNDRAPLSRLDLTLPPGSRRDMAIFQQALPKRCLSYDIYPGSFSCANLTDADFKDFIDYPKGILGDQQPSYTASYLKAPYTADQSTYSVTLPLPVKQYKATALVVSYIAQGYAAETYPGYIRYSFTTFKVPALFHTEQVAVDVENDAGLYIYDDRAKRIMNRSVITGYTNEYYPAGGSVPIASLDHLVIAAGKTGARTFKSQVLLSGQTFTVTGEFARNEAVLYYAPFLGYANGILVALGTLLALLIALRLRKLQH